jgi:RNA polymerase-binding transcription factor DksA
MREEHVESKDWTVMRRALQEREQDLKQVILASEAAVRDKVSAREGEAAVDFNHPADAMHGDGDYERDLQLLRRQRAELTLVEQALHRMDEGTYGSCEECGGKMSQKRLEAVPYARYCVACQERTEKEEQGSGDRERFFEPGSAHGEAIM